MSSTLSIRVEAAGVAITFTVSEGQVAVEQSEQISTRPVTRIVHRSSGDQLVVSKPQVANGNGAVAPGTKEEISVSPDQATDADQSDAGAPAPRRQIKAWSPEEIARLAALWRDHTGGEIARILNRPLHAVKARLRRSGLRKAALELGIGTGHGVCVDGPNRVIAKPHAGARKPGPKPRSLSAAAMVVDVVRSEPLPVLPDEPVPLAVFGPVLLSDHRAGQCRWLIREQPPTCCGLAVVGSGSWCEQHSKRATRPTPPMDIRGLPR